MYTEWTNRILESATIAKPSDQGNNENPNPVTGTENPQYGIRVYPNPFRDILNVKTQEAPSPTKHLSLVNSTGQTIQNIPMNTQGTVLIPTADLAAGTYFITLRDNKTEILRERITKL
jgi:hypothetical protein